MKKVKNKSCSSCERVMKLKAKGMCQNCWHKYKRRYNLNFFLRTRFSELRQRCTNPNSTDGRYNGMKYCTRQQFLDLFFNDKKLHKLYKIWQKSKFQYKLCPSIDRIDVNKGYVIGNMQFIPHGQNARKDQKMIKVDVFTLTGKFLSTHEALNDAAKYHNVHQANAWKVLYGKRKHTERLVFKFAS